MGTSLASNSIDDGVLVAVSADLYKGNLLAVLFVNAALLFVDIHCDTRSLALRVTVVVSEVIQIKSFTLVVMDDPNMPVIHTR